MQLAEQPVSTYEALRQYNAAEMPSVETDLAAAAKLREMMFGVPAELFQSPIITLCSVWPELMESKPFQHGGVGRKIYRIAPGSPERPSYLSLQNTFHTIQTQVGSQEIGYMQPPALAKDFVVDLIQQWTGDHPANTRGKKGIGVIKGRQVENGRVEATPEEIAALANMQKGWLEFLVERADEWYDNGKREKISGEHRKALKMTGQDINLHPWYRAKLATYNVCPRCAERILIEANFCKHCRTDLVTYFMDLNEIPTAEQWPTVVKAMERLTKKADAKVATKEK